jgi:PEP-CTERM motif
MKKLLTLVAPLTLLASALPAQAATIVFQARGTASGTDRQGLIGGGTFSNQPFTLRATFDTNTVGANLSVDPNRSILTGGFSFGTLLSPLSGAVLRIGPQRELVFGGDDGLFHSAGIGVERTDSGDVAQFLAEGGLGEFNIVFDGPQIFDGLPSFTTGDLLLANLRRNQALFIDSAGPNETRINFTITNAGFFALAAVPEPATWTMMILGFGMIGFSMRQKRAVRQLVSA